MSPTERAYPPNISSGKNGIVRLTEVCLSEVSPVSLRRSFFGPRAGSVGLKGPCVSLRGFCVGMRGLFVGLRNEVTL